MPCTRCSVTCSAVALLCVNLAERQPRFPNSLPCGAPDWETRHLRGRGRQKRSSSTIAHGGECRAPGPGAATDVGPPARQLLQLHLFWAQGRCVNTAGSPTGDPPTRRRVVTGPLAPSSTPGAEATPGTAVRMVPVTGSGPPCVELPVPQHHRDQRAPPHGAPRCAAAQRPTPLPSCCLISYVSPTARTILTS